jgi:DNA-binding transcriptional LysR family regulator
MECDSKLKGSSLPGLASAIDLHHLRCAVAAADHGSFRRAAEASQLRQSTLSRCVRQLEERIQMTVFERSSGGVRATPAGGDFLRAARSILDQMNTLVTIAHNTGRGETGRLTVGFYTSLCGNLRAALAEYAGRFPQMEIGLNECSRAPLGTALRNGALDIAIVTGETPLPDNEIMRLWSERIVIVMSEHHRLAARDSIHWTDLKGETLLLSRRELGSEFQDLLLEKLTSPNDRPRLVHHDVTEESIKNLVGAGFGVSLLSEASLNANASGLIFRKIRDGAGSARIGYSANWRKDNHNPALAGFLRLLGERYSSPMV